MEKASDKWLKYRALTEDKKEGFVLLIVGKPGSGKTTIIQGLLSNCFRGVFNFILLMSPSHEEYAGLIPEGQRAFDVDLPWLTKAINMINVNSQSSTEQQKVLIIIDDCISTIKDTISAAGVRAASKAATQSTGLPSAIPQTAPLPKGPQQSLISSLFFNHRHLLWNGRISLIVTTQKYTMLPARFRSTITDLVMFGISPFDSDKIWSESIIKYTKQEWKEMVAQLFTCSFKALYLNIDTQTILST